MADLKYNIGNLFKQAFGVNSPIFITQDLRQENKAEFSFKGIEILPEYYNADATSWMGTPIMFQTKFLGGTYKRFGIQGLIEQVKMADLALPPATIFSFRRSKEIIRTKVAGHNGSVKEIYGFDDWIIDVRGLCLDEPTISAQKQFEELLKWEKLADAIKVEGSQFNSRDIARVCIQDFSTDSPQGKPGVISFQMTMFSDEPLQLGLSV